MTNDTIIRAENVSRCLNQGRPNEVWPVRDVSLQVNRGEAVVLKGPSGSGKTSLLSLLGCMSRPTEGRIFIHDRDVAKLPERLLTEIRRKRFGFIFQQFNLISGISVRENVMLPLYPVDLPFREMRERADSLMNRLGLFERRNFKVKGLSGGEQQRVAIARALVNDPEVIFADEPTAHLDTKLSHDIVGILEELKEEGRTILIATHDPLLYEQGFIDRVIEMRDGSIR
jgi:putative ABC transport system ATP-binding protein